MFCTNCGGEIKDGAGFCTWCGAKVQKRGDEAPAEKPEVATAPEPAPEPLAAPEPAPVPLAAPEPAPVPLAAPEPAPAPTPEPTPAPAPNPAPKKRRGGLIAVIVVAALVIVGAAGFLLWSLVSGSPIAIDGENFPSPAVRSAISEQLDPDGDGKITREEAGAATKLSISGTCDVSGLGAFFPNLTELFIDAEQADDGDTIAVGDLPKLTVLEVANATASSIDLSGNKELETLTVSNTPITSLDLSNNTQLTDLTLTTTEVGELDLSANTALESLAIEGDGEGEITLPATETLTSVTVPDNRPLSGIESTGLREAWDMTSIYMVPAFFGDASDRADIERDDQGKITSIVANNNRGTDTYDFTYDESGNLTGYAFSALDSDDVTLAYNEDGTIASAEGALTSRHYTYDDQGRVATMELVDEGGPSTTTFTYDEAGNLMSEHTASEGSTGYTEVEYAYDEAGTLTKRVEREVWTEDVAGTGGPGSAETIFEYEYDASGNCVKTTITSGGTNGDKKTDVVEVAVFEATYNEDGSIAEFVANTMGGREPVVETYVYDDRGVLTEIQGSENGGYNYEFEYERRLVAKDDAAEAGFDFVSDPMSGIGLGQNIYYDYCTYYLLPPDYVGSSAMNRLSMVICDI